jgi:multiple sugar transport system permease protein
MTSARPGLARRSWAKGGVYLFLGGYAAWSLLPVLWVLLSSFKSNVDVLTVPPKLVFTPTLSNYPGVLETVPGFWHVALNSVVVAAVGTAVIVGLALPAAYALNRFTRVRRGRLGLSIISARTFPTIALAIPLYMLMQSAGLLDTKTSVILANVAFSLPFAIWMIYGFVDSVPREIEEAAAIDGCSRLGTLIRVVTPTILPGVGATAILTSVVAWREFLFPLVLTSSNAQTLPVVIGNFITGSGTDWGQLCAFAVITIAPVAAFSLFVGKYLVLGFSSGGVKQ